MSNFLADIDTMTVDRAFDLADLRAMVRDRKFCAKSGRKLTTPNAVLVIMTGRRHRMVQVNDAEVFDVCRPGYELLARQLGAPLKIIDGRTY